MKIGIASVNVGYPSGEAIAAVASKAEQVGVESVWTFEHVIVPVDYQSRYPYHGSGKMPAKPDTSFVDPLIALSFVAAHTERLRIGTSVNILPQANPLLVAKQVASLDFVSAGRMMFGVGVGWLREEFDAMGVPFERRGKRFDDYLSAIAKVWSGDIVEHDSEFLSWSGFLSHPLPIQKPRPPILVGGTSKPAYRRAARHGDGWIAPMVEPDELAGQLEGLHAAARDQGRDPSSLEITVMWNYDGDMDKLARFRDLGVSRVIIPMHRLGRDPIAGLDALGDAVIAKLA